MADYLIWTFKHPKSPRENSQRVERLCKTLSEAIKKAVELKRATNHGWVRIEQNGKYVGEVSETYGWMYRLHKIDPRTKKESITYLNENGNVFKTEKMYNVKSDGKERQFSTFKDALAYAMRCGIDTYISIVSTKTGKSEKYKLVGSPFSKGSIVLLKSNLYDDDYYSIGKDGSIRFIPYYKAMVSGDDPHRNEFFRSTIFTAQNKDSAKKIAVDFMDRLAKNNPGYDVYDVTLKIHSKKLEFTGTSENLATIDYRM